MRTFSGLAAILARGRFVSLQFVSPTSELKFKFQILWDWKLAAAFSAKEVRVLYVVVVKLVAV
jgi:hypothetical protein